MRVIREYKRAESLEEAWQLNQKKSNRVLGGMVWLKMGKMQIGTAIDLSSLGLDTIEETLEQYADQFPVNAPVERWKSTLQSLCLMDTMNRSTTGSEHKIRLEKLQAQTEALFNEIFHSLDSGDAQIED